MTTTINKVTTIKPGMYVREVWQEESALFGLLTWNRLVFSEKIGEELRIAVERVPEEILINGVKYIPEK